MAVTRPVFDNALELLVAYRGRSLPHSVMMMIPEAWQKHEGIDARRKSATFYEYHSVLDGTVGWSRRRSHSPTGLMIGAVLDRNGLRPSRYVVTKDGLVVMASEVGCSRHRSDEDVVATRTGSSRAACSWSIPQQGRIIDDEEIKNQI